MTEPEDALAAAPLLRRVRERHPDVDVVVLPPEPRAEAERLPAVPVDPSTVDAERALVDGTAADLVAAAGSPDTPTGSWRSAARGAVVPVAEARLPFGEPDEGIRVGRAVAARLREQGWDGRLDRTGATVLLLATRDDRSARVAWLEDVVLVTVRGRELPVDPATARALVTGQGDER